ncbi:CapA family protein [Capilliphycus salinus ALCB114379]|uniref:CapA family protein n=1 Tax=Capilliphycus salinus TaxID=2768948 RepID=UPI0039A68877
MSQQNLIKLAQQGDANAIATLINHALHSKGVIAQATRRDRHLYILLESEQLPNQSSCIRVIQNGILRLGTTAITLITIRGQKTHHQSSGWTHTIALQTSVASAKTCVPTMEDESAFTPAKSIPAPSHFIPTSANPPTKIKKTASRKVKQQGSRRQIQPPPVKFPKVLLPQPVKQLLMAGSIGLMMAPLSGWFFTVQQDRISEFSRTVSQTLASVPTLLTSGLQNIQAPSLPELPEFSFSSAGSTANSEPVSEEETLKNLNKFSELTLTSLQNPISPDLRIKIKAVGDIIPGTNYPSNKLPASKEALFQDVKPALQGADIVFGNFESTLTNYPSSAKNVGRGLVFAFRTPPEYTSILKDAGFDILSVANNHSFDFFEAGFDDTIENINKLGMKAVGRKDEIVYHEVKGVKFAFIGFSYFSVHNNMLDLEASQAIVKKAEAEGADVIVISVHAGAEGTAALNIYNKTEYFYGENRGNKVLFARTLIDAGADLVLGHGPHVPRALELYKGKLIAYSLGNFMGYRTLSTKAQLGYSLVLEADLDPVGNFKGGKIIPIHLDSKGIPYRDNNFRSVGLIRSLTQSNFPETPLEIDSQGQILLKSD